MSGALPSDSRILERLYASVLEVAALEGLARALCQRFASHLVSFQVDGLPSGHLPIAHFDDTGARVHGLIEILTNSELGNPFMEDGRAARLAKIGTGHEEGLFRPGTLERTAFYRQALVPFDIRHSLGFCLHAGPAGDVIAMTINRSIRRGHYGERDMHLAHRLLPHLRNVYQLQQRMRLVAHASETLDAFGECLWLLDPRGRVVHANTPAQALLADRAAPLRQIAHALHAAWPADRPPLEAAIGNATSATAHGAAPSQRAWSVRRRRAPASVASGYPAEPASCGGRPVRALPVLKGTACMRRSAPPLWPEPGRSRPGLRTATPRLSGGQHPGAGQVAGNRAVPAEGTVRQGRSADAGRTDRAAWTRRRTARLSARVRLSLGDPAFTQTGDFFL
jgi:hypothetical protein